MRVHSQFLKAVAFLCVKDRRGQKKPVGTAFFVSTPDGPDVFDSAAEEWTSGDTFNHVVTARHCIEDNKDDPPIYLRFNTSTGQCKDIETHKHDWLTHKDADVAAMLLTGDNSPDEAEIEAIPIRLFIGAQGTLDVNYESLGIDDRRAEAFRNGYPDGLPVGLGDDLFFPGLFTQSAGHEQNLPIVRFGNIARMPADELIVLRSAARGDIEVRAYLAEVHSWGGHSGSPVFWHHEMLIPETYWVRGLLGLVSAHFDVTRRGGRVRTDETALRLNSGIAVVTPAENIRELLVRKDMVEQREEEKRARQSDRPAATADFSSEPRQKTRARKAKHRVEIPTPRRSDFFRDLEKATQRKKPSE